MTESKKKRAAEPVCISGAVVSGKKLGRCLGFPTANQSMPEGVAARRGIYASTVEIGGVRYAAVSNIGTRPTVGGEEVNCESHILDFSGDLYGCEIRTTLCAFLREERRFASVEELRAQIELDAVRAREYFKNLKRK